jgi:hypothetical protein
VAFLIFNRPETTEQVFEAIRQARPPVLLVVADGPRPDRPGEESHCGATRAVIDRVDWPCEVLKNYSDVNLGCKRRISSGLDWVFSQVEETIILEDDSLPHPGFFRYCEELLDRFRSDERIGMISGDNFQYGRRRTPYSYYFSLYPHIWGWASWRRVWRRYNLEMSNWPEIRDGGWLHDIFQDPRTASFWKDHFDRSHRGKIDSWDYQLFLTLLVHGLLCVAPNTNLVSNIGFGPRSTHTRRDNFTANLPVFPMEFPLRHPPFVIRDRSADRFEQKTVYDPGFLLKLRQVLGLPFRPREDR